MGRRWIQLQGFTMLALLYVLIGTFFDDLVEMTPLFLTLYGATFFFSNFGPNVSTYVIPSELFPTEVPTPKYSGS